MTLEFFCPHWGSEELPFEIFAEKVVADGYDGIEMSLPLLISERKNILSIIRKLMLTST
ncbi:hypothetical protein ACFQ3S_04775 [Mucilaginibacter terrae]|uniref:hypothetical protein n=1 Tax=Mucilaginibacter terrae TaxID=1955052 RepID=UPI00363F297B